MRRRPNYRFIPIFVPISHRSAILKPSELTPHLSGMISQLIGELFAPDEVAIFQGDADVSKALLDLPFDHIFFTGSPTVGKYVMGAAAQHLASVTLELGGKSPTIIDASADLELAATSVMFGKFSNAGQTCIAPDYVFVHESVKARWLECCKAELQKAYGADAAAQQASKHYTRIVNPRHTARIKALLDDAQAHVQRVWQIFGADRCIWASDWPYLRATSRLDYGPMLKLTERYCVVFQTINTKPELSVAINRD